MRDPIDAKLRELTFRLVEMSPEAPPFPEAPMVQLQQSPPPISAPPPKRRSPLVWVGATALGVLLLVGLPLGILLATRDPEPDPVGTTQPSVTVTPPTTGVTPPTTGVTPPTSVPAGPTGVTVKVYMFNDFAMRVDGSPGLVPVERFLDYDAPQQIDEIEIMSRTLGVLVNDGVLASDPEGLHTEVPDGIAEVGISDQGDGIWRVDLPGAFADGGGSATMFGRLAQVVYTATQFPTVEGVTFALDGSPITVFSPEGIVLEGPQTRDGYRDQLAQVFVDAPGFGATVTSPFTVSGEALVSGDTFMYRLEGGGAVLDEGFVTASGGGPDWLQYSFEVTFTIDSPVAAELVLFDESAPDGAIVNPVMYALGLTTESGDQPAVQGQSFEIDNNTAGITAPMLSGESVLAATYGTAANQVGLDAQKLFGPCCFDVTADGTLVVLDSQNLRITAWPEDGEPYVVREFDAADFVPDAVAVSGDRVITVGLTNRTGSPYDVIALDLATGQILERQENVFNINVGLRESVGRVWAELPGFDKGWVPVTDVLGNLVPRTEALAALPMGDRDVAIRFTPQQADVTVTVSPAGAAPSRYRFVSGISDIFAHPAYADGLVTVTVFDIPADFAGVATVMVTGSEGGQAEAVAAHVPIQQYSEMGTYNWTRYESGFLYVMSTSQNGMEINRYELPLPTQPEVPTDADLVLIDAFVDFARNPNTDTASALPFADRVQLGLGPDLHVDAARSELTDPATWTIDIEFFRAYTGPFSILEIAARDTTLQTSVGPHNHCAGPPMPAPVGLETSRRVSAQNTEGDSCLVWTTFDLFLNDAGEIIAVTMDVWEP